MANILLLSGYHALSQEQWANTLQAYGHEHRWMLLALPGRYFSWRMRGNPLSFAALNQVALQDTYDLIIATSSVDLATVQSIYPSLRSCKSVLYFHENQFAYPAGRASQHTVDWQITSLYSALRADFIVFNSAYNKNSFLEGVSRLLKKVPDLVPKDITNTLALKTGILPVPIADVNQQVSKPSQRESINVLWNHRWEWDKQPELLLEVIKLVCKHKLPITFSITGQSFRSTPDALDAISSCYADKLTHFGFVENRGEYERMLVQSDVVLSTAIHEFQGIAVLEAASRGCIPLLPNRLSYPEYYDTRYLYDGAGSLAQQAEAIFGKLNHWLDNDLPSVFNTQRFQKTALAPAYREALQRWLQ